MERLKHVKKTIGFLIKYYRKQSSKPLSYYLETNSHFMNETCSICNQCDNPKTICSKNTLYRLEEGQVISNECVYMRLADKLNRTVIFNQIDIYNKLDFYRKTLIDSLIDFSKTKLENLNSKIEFDLNKHKDVLYVYEILLLYQTIIQNKLYNPKVSKETIDLIYSLKDYVLDEDRKIILCLFIGSSFRYGGYDIDANLINESAKEYIDDPLFYGFKLETICNQNLLIAHRELTEKELPKLSTKTTYQKHIFFNYLEYVQLNAKMFEETYDSTIKNIELIKQSDFGNATLKNCYLHLGIVTYLLHKYNETVEWLLKALEINHFLSKDIPLLCSALERTNKKDIIPQILKEIDFSRIKSSYGKEVYAYYKLKYEKQSLTKDDIIRLEDFICSTLKPHLETMGTLHKGIFDEDLKTYIKTTRNFKKYYEFNS